MNLEEAYRILGLSLNSSKEEAKKKYHTLAKELHPDINKEPGAEEKFKKINEAYSCIQSGKGTDKEDFMHGNPFEGFSVNPFANPFTGGFKRQRANINAQHILQNTTISFKESVLGCHRNISYTRKIKCPQCNGCGAEFINNNCTKCHGVGTITRQQGNMVFTQTCDKCNGKVNTKACDKCKSSGIVEAEVSVQVNIPGGIINGNILRLGAMGNFVTNFMGMEQYTDVHLTVSVTPHNSLTIVNNDVVTTIQISLLEALQGCSKQVETIDGMNNINIKPKSKNSEEIVLPNMGVNKIGSQRVILDIQYPDNVTDLVNYLSQIKSAT
jgi:molecular chaperone DnaJ